MIESANLPKELTIVGSLTSIVLDLLHYHLLNEGLNLGLVGSGLSVGSPSWPWSTEFISGIKASILPRPIFAFLFALLVSCTLLATTVGPASALLFILIQLWVPSASTDFYIGGTEDML